MVERASSLIMEPVSVKGFAGAGLGANHRTGWTGIIARAMHLFATTTAEQVLELGRKAGIVEVEK